MRTDNPTKGSRDTRKMCENRLTVEQLQSLNHALADYSDQSASDAIRLLAVTGSREAEVLSATWEQFDLKRGIWTKPSHHTKQKKIERVPLNRAGLDVLNRMEKARTGLHLFPGRFQGAAGNGSDACGFRYAERLDWPLNIKYRGNGAC